MSEAGPSRAAFLSQRTNNAASKSQHQKKSENRFANIVGSEYQFDDHGQLKSDRFSEARQSNQVKPDLKSAISLYQLGSENGANGTKKRGMAKKLFP